MIRIALAALLAAPAAFAAEYHIDPVHSSANFQVKHLMVSKVNGNFKSVSGTINFDEKAPEKTTINAVIDATSIDTGDPKRDGHLKSPDFFDAGKHPKITFKSTSVLVEGPGKYKVAGDLTIRGITKPATLEVEGFDQAIEAFGGVRRGATATTTINRKDFGVSWNQNLDKGGVAVSDEVKITLEIEASHKPEKAASK